jgi:beta-glucosidase
MTGVLAEAFVKGLQGNHPRYVRANAGCKHFAAYSGPENIPESRMSFNALVTERDFRMTYLPAFKRCVEAGTYSIMCSYHRINGVPACANHRLLTEILRNEWGFTGYVISDELAIENIKNRHNYTTSIEQTCEYCIKAGCNLEDGPPVIPPDFRGITSAVQMGLLNDSEVRESIKPLFYTRMRLGQFDPPELNPFATLDPNDYVQSPAHQALSLKVALKSFVLLKNTNNFLPLPEGTVFGKLAIVGPMADNIPGIFGNYAPDPDPRYVVTPLQGLSALGETVAFAEGCRNSNPRCDEYNSTSVIEATTGADFVIICVGTGRSIEAEANDRADIDFPGEQLQLIQDAVQGAGAAPVLLLLFNAGPLDITWAKNSDRIGAIIECFFPGQTTGEALRRTILNEGDSANPAGRLPNTWPAFIGQYPPMIDYGMENRTYRYFSGDPLYPFGYGLSYSSFRYLSLVVRPTTITANDSIEVEVSVINDGPLVGEEVVQVYVAWNAPSLPTPKLQLVAFNRYELSVGQVQTAIFQVKAEQLAVWNDSPPELVVLNGVYTVYAGGQQPNQLTSAPSNILTGNFAVAAAPKLPKTKMNV